MIHQILAGTASIWPVIGLGFFVVFFSIVLLWTFRGGRDRFERQRLLPLNDEPQPHDQAPKGALHEYPR